MNEQETRALTCHVLEKVELAVRRAQHKHPEMSYEQRVMGELASEIARIIWENRDAS